MTLSRLMIPSLFLILFTSQSVLPGINQTLQNHLKEYDVILKPDQEKPEWWAGAPSVIQDQERIFWMACRMRTADAPRGLRGYEIRIMKSNDGIHFENIHRIHRTDIPIPGFERPVLLIDPHSGKYKLYLCGPWKGGAWTIIKLDDVDHPSQFEPTTARPVIQAIDKKYERDVIPHEYKDPTILYANGNYHCYVIGVMRRIERIFHFTSKDGEEWEPVGSPYQPILELTGWHNFYVRPGCVVPLGIGYLFVYEGFNVSWYDPVYNIATGIGFTHDLHTIIDLTPDEPLFKSSTPSEHFFTFRYSHWLLVKDEIWIYAEVATPKETHEIRRFTIPVPALQQMTTP